MLENDKSGDSMASFRDSLNSDPRSPIHLVKQLRAIFLFKLQATLQHSFLLSLPVLSNLCRSHAQRLGESICESLSLGQLQIVHEKVCENSFMCLLSCTSFQTGMSGLQLIVATLKGRFTLVDAAGIFVEGTKTLFHFHAVDQGVGDAIFGG